MTESLVSGAPHIRIAALDAQDALRYRALMLHAYEAAADAFTSTPQERAAEPLSWWVARLADPQGLSHAFGAFLGDELLGTVTLEFSAKPKTRHKAHLIGMFVAQAARGQGAGRALLQAAMRLAGDRPGVRVVTLTVTEGNAPAIAASASSPWPLRRRKASRPRSICGGTCGRPRRSAARPNLRSAALAPRPDP
jgi:RimJ/RimL family protein N-acetyltransferase